MTRWEGLFADLEAQAAALAGAELAAEVDERARGELAQVRVVDRLRAAVGQPVRVRCLGGFTGAGRIERVGPDWVLLVEETGHETLLLLSGVLGLAGVPRWSAVPGSEGQVAARLGVRSVLRALTRDRSAVRIQLADGSVLDATLDRVGADFIEVATHPAGEPRRRTEVREVHVVPLAGIVAVRRHRPS